MNEDIGPLITGLVAILLPIIIWQGLQKGFPKMKVGALVGFTVLALFGLFIALVVIRTLFVLFGH